MKVNAQNERLKMEWAKGLAKEWCVATVDQKLAAVAEYEAATDWQNFTDLSDDSVAEFIAATLKRDVSSKTRNATVKRVKHFFEWMVMAEYIKGKRAHGPICALKLSKKDRRAGRASKPRPPATLDQVRDTVLAMPKNTAIERRDRALMAFTILSGARDGALITMKLKHVDLADRQVFQHPDEVATKGSAHIFTWFFPVGQAMIDEVADYIAYLRDDLGFGDNDPLFAATAMGHDENDQFCPAGLTKRHWASTQPVRDIYRAAFKSQGLPYFNPHSIRKTLMAYAYELGLTGEELKAWSQNLGHDKLDTSINSYGKVSHDRQRAAILGLHKERPALAFDPDAPLTLRSLQALIAKGEISP